MRIANERNSNNINAAIQYMLKLEEEQEDSYIGIFWYNPKDNELFGINKVPSIDIDFYYSNEYKTYIKTCRALHKQTWIRNFRNNINKTNNRFIGDFKMVPRGRVFEFKDSGFKVFTGKWINDYPQAKIEIINEFNLPKDKTEFCYDYHWDIGNSLDDEY